MTKKNNNITQFILAGFLLLFSIKNGIALNNESSELPGDSLDVVFIFDKSASLNINNNVKFALPAAEYLVEFLEMCQKKLGIIVRLAYIPFGESLLKGNFSLNDLDTQLKNRILKEIKTGTASKTDFLPPLEKAKELFNSSQNRKRLIVLFTDGIPDMQREIRSQYPSKKNVLKYFKSSGIKELIGNLTKKDVSIEVIGINDRLYDITTSINKNNVGQIKKLWDDCLKSNKGSFHSTNPDISDAIIVVNSILIKSIDNMDLKWMKLQKGENKFYLGKSIKSTVVTIIQSDINNIQVILQNNKKEKWNPDLINRNGCYFFYSINDFSEEQYNADFTGNGDAWIGINKKYYKDFYISNENINKPTNDKLKPSNRLFVFWFVILCIFVLFLCIISALLFKKNRKIIKEWNEKNEHEIKLILKNETLEKERNEIQFEKNKSYQERDKLLQEVEEFKKELKIEKEKNNTLSLENFEKKITEELKKVFEEINYALINPTTQSVNKAIAFLISKLPDIKEYELKQFQNISGLKESFDSIYYANQKIRPGNNFENVKFVFDLINKESYSSFVLKATAGFLWNTRWKDNSFDQIVFDIYNILENLSEPGPVLSYIVETGKQHKANRFVSILTRIYYWNKKEALEENIINYMSEIQMAFMDFRGTVLGDAGFKLFDSLKKLYDEICKTPYPAEIEFPEIENLENEYKILTWENTVYDYKKIFCDINKLDYNSGLNSFESFVSNYNNGTNLKFPEVKIFSIIMEKWHGDFKNISLEPVIIEYQFAPLLKIDDEMLRNINCSKFSLIFKNKSNGNAFNLKVELMRNGKIQDGDKSILKLDRKETKATKLFKVDYPIESYEILFSYEINDTKPKRREIINGIVDTIDRNSIPTYEKNGVCPYIYDRSLEPGDLYMSRENIEEKITLNIIKSKDSDIFHILGVRKIGKTSLINHIKEKISNNKKNIIVITVPCTIFENRSWTHEYLLGYLAVEIKSLFTDRKNFFKNFTVLPSDSKIMRKDEFKIFISQVMTKKAIDEKLLIIFDDADVLEESCIINKKRKDLFVDLRGFIENYLVGLIEYIRSDFKGGLYIIFSGWKDVLGEIWSKVCTLNNQKNINIYSFNKAQVKEIAHWGGYKYNNLSFEFLWRLTGGFPFITQLICGLVWNEMNKLREKSNTVPLSVLNKVIYDICSNTYYWGDLAYIINFGLPPNIRSAFFKILEDLNLYTLQFKNDEIEKKCLIFLQQTEFIEIDEDMLIGSLRIGIFKLMVSAKSERNSRIFLNEIFT